MKKIGLVATVVLGSLAAYYFLRPTPLPQSQPTRLSLKEFLQHGPACYHWSEIYGDVSRTHSGGLIFTLHGDTVFSTAWYTTAQPARAWPLVSGNGFLDGDTLQIAYRNATGDPAHAFYHAACRFQIDPVTREFHCDFTQQAGPIGEISPGAAHGVLVASPGPEFDAYLPALLAKASTPQQQADTEHCPVLTENAGKPENSLVYNGRTFHFCCTSCMKVFQARPEAFAKSH